MNTQVPEENPPMQQFIFADNIQGPTELKVGDLLRWYDPEEDKVVLCFKLDPTGEWNYGEFILMRSEFDWEQLGSMPPIDLTDKELDTFDMRLGNDFTFSRVRITVEHFSDSEDMVRATITGTAVDKDQQSHDFRLSSQFHVVRPEKHALYWQQRLTASLVDRVPHYSTDRHYTAQSDYGLRYGDYYFTEFKTADGELILIQLVFDSPDTCDLYVARPDDPNIEDEDRTFAFTEAGLEEMTAYINRRLTKR